MRSAILISSSISFFVGLFLGVCGYYLNVQYPVDVNGFDHNGDGILDEKYIMKNGRIDELRSDRNFDGKDDYILKFLPTGHLATSTSDENFDGVFETESSYVYNQPNSVRTDVNGDGEVDLLAYYQNGIMTKVIIINPKNKLKEKENYFKLGKLVKSHKDIDSDGKFDIECTYSFFEEELTCKDI